MLAVLDFALENYFGVLWGHAGCPLFGVERCPLLGGSKYTISIGIAIGGMGFVRCTEIVHFSDIRSFTVYVIIHIEQTWMSHSSRKRKQGIVTVY